MPGNTETATRRRVMVEADTDARLDVWIAEQVPELSRTQVATLIGEGHVRVNGKTPKKRDRPRAGDVIDIDVPAPRPSTYEAEPIALAIVYEDADLLVIDKPAGMVVHPAVGHRSGTLVNALLHHFDRLSTVGGPARPGIVHRLDKQTSGLMLVAKHDVAHRRLAAQLKRREIRRTYRVAAWGHLAEDRLRVEAPIGRSHRNRKRMAVVPAGKPALTHFRRLERWVAADLLEARLETGRTHQIRVHLQSIGHPVVGDREYGAGAERGVSGSTRPWAQELARRTPRQFLHAARIAFVQPMTGERLSFEAPLAADLADVAEWARRSSGAAG